MNTRAVQIKLAIVAFLAITPVLALVGFGCYYLYERGWSYYSYFPMTACWLMAYVLGWYWTRKPKSANIPTEPIPQYWTERDERAWAIVQEHAQATRPDPIGNFASHSQQAEELALAVARVYVPDAKQPFDHLTLPEIMTCGELITQDLNRLAKDYVPGSHLVRIGDLKRVQSLADQASIWYPRLQKMYWAVSAIFRPVETATQVLVSKAGFAPASSGMQQNLWLWLQSLAVTQSGRYLIELNSGRLKVGAQRYRELLALQEDPTKDQPAQEDSAKAATSGQLPISDDVKPITPTTSGNTKLTLGIVGPTKAGKSTLVNCLLSDDQAQTDVVPLTSKIAQYHLKRPQLPDLVLLDSVGFGQQGADAGDIKAAVHCASMADVIVLVLPARSAARQPEVKFLDDLRAAIENAPDLKMPPVIIALSHIDLLTPAREWTPPYNWKAGQRAKEVSIREAVEACRELFAQRVFDVVPMCMLANQEQGVDDELLASLERCLPSARGVAILRAFHQEASAKRYRRVAGQVLNAGQQILGALFDSSSKRKEKAE